jgi:hypothetical protein
MFGLDTRDILDTEAYRSTSGWSKEDVELITISRVLAFAENTWKKHISAIRSFLEFCKLKNKSVFECSPLHINLYLLTEAQNKKSFGSLESFLEAYAFLTKFFNMPNVATDTVVNDVKKFCAKVTVQKTNKKDAFGIDEVRKLWFGSLKNDGDFEKWSKLKLRTFVLAIFQHKTFCRFSDTQNILLENVQFNTGYFKILVQKSKTDQSAKGEYVYLTKVSYAKMDAHLLFCKYLQIMGFEDCNSNNTFLFPPLKYDKNLKDYVIVPGKPVSYSVALRYFKSMLKSVHLDPRKFGLHSPRIGATTDAFFDGVPDHIIDQQGRWKCQNSKYSYLRKNELHFLSHVKKFTRY